MKRIIGLFGLSLFASAPALAVPDAGTTVMGASGSVHLTPGDLTVNVGGSYGTFLDGGIFVGGGADLGVLPEIAVAVNGTAQYWMELGDMDAFAGLDLSLPVMPAFSYTVNVDIGVAKWLSDTFAITVTNTIGGLLEGAITDDIVIGTMAVF